MNYSIHVWKREGGDYLLSIGRLGVWAWKWVLDLTYRRPLSEQRYSRGKVYACGGTHGWGSPGTHERRQKRRSCAERGKERSVRMLSTRSNVYSGGGRGNNKGFLYFSLAAASKIHKYEMANSIYWMLCVTSYIIILLNVSSQKKSQTVDECCWRWQPFASLYSIVYIIIIWKGFYED